MYKCKAIFTLTKNAWQFFTLILLVEYKVVRKLIILSEHLFKKGIANGSNVVTFMLYYDTIT